jgi:hypothetical protein
MHFYNENAMHENIYTYVNRKRFYIWTKIMSQILQQPSKEAWVLHSLHHDYLSFKVLRLTRPVTFWGSELNVRISIKSAGFYLKIGFFNK